MSTIEQAFLNQKAQNKTHMAAQMMVAAWTKTACANYAKAFTALSKILYSDELKELTFTELYTALTIAQQIFNKSEGDEMENQSHVH